MKKHISLYIILLCVNFCYGQQDNLHIEAHQASNLIIVFPDTDALGKRVKIVCINDDTGCVFSYSTEDSSLFVSDSLRTIKGLIKMLLDHFDIGFGSAKPDITLDDKTSAVKPKKIKNKK